MQGPEEKKNTQTGYMIEFEPEIFWSQFLAFSGMQSFNLVAILKALSITTEKCQCKSVAGKLEITYGSVHQSI